ncbi:hypothetical protein CRV00_00865 [Malaciobacter molluscorum]|uniref:dihydrolipoyl dehydrogenase family protein n=1 Tax=Malaciobacter molluscorum TaxID=1032072 RepID=UPI00100AB42F|nr:FAD-dependent oxidoreductase [Malaciobacter molluscorum]RXJ97418.1 hypothetical protein CRV00_00865 [Malaciobacter molluscorum]
MKTFDLIIIGAGRGSYLAAKAANLGKKVAIIEKSKLGGTCPNRGCVPSKLLIGYANKIREIKSSKKHYIKSFIDDIDIEKIFADTNDYINSVEDFYEKKFNENVTVYRGEASFVENKVIKINKDKITAENIVISTGSRPAEPLTEGSWTSDNIFPLKQIPKSITIVGAGFIACELANFFDAIEVKTIQLVRGDTLLENEDKDIQEIFKEQYTKNVDVRFNTSIKEATKQTNNHFKIELEDGNFIQTEALLYAIGRVSNADTLNLENTDIKLNEKGFIKRDEFFQTDVKGVYAVGDASGENMLQHAAAYEVNHLSKILFEDKIKPLKFKYMPHAVFSDPEVASVGLTEQKAKNLNLNYVVSTTNWKASAKAKALKIEYPQTKFILNPYTYEILGCHLIGFESATIIHQVLAVMHIDNDIRHLKNMLYIHPALSEVLLPAAVNAIKVIKEYKKSQET